MCDSVKHTPNTGVSTISVANSNLDGTGTIVDIITGSQDGTYIQSVTIKSQVSNNQGIVRFFVKPSGGSTYFLIQEVIVPATTPTGVVQSFSATLEQTIPLSNGETFAASTENAETFNIVAYGYDVEFCNCP